VYIHPEDGSSPKTEVVQTGQVVLTVLLATDKNGQVLFYLFIESPKNAVKVEAQSCELLLRSMAAILFPSTSNEQASET
jgi:hypothetical protein